jgi:hypothetical protein
LKTETSTLTAEDRSYGLLGPRKTWVNILPGEARKIEGQTSRLCPHCFKKGEKRVRKRRYSKSIPLPKSKCGIDEEYPVRQPRVSSRQAWWNLGPIRWLIAPDPSLPWFKCFEMAECPVCGPERVIENDCKRQFGRARLLEFLLRGQFTLQQLRDWNKIKI